MNNTELKEKLIDELDVPKSHVNGIIAKINRFQPETAAAFEKWYNSGEIDAGEVEGYTVKQIMEDKKVNAVTAFLWLDWLRRDPKTAKNAMFGKEFANSAVTRPVYKK